MKNLVIIVHANLQQELADRLHELEQVQGFTFSHVEGHSDQVEHDTLLSARDKVVGYTPRVRVDILLEDIDVDAVLEAIRSEKYGITGGHGLYWVTTVHQSGRL